MNNNFPELQMSQEKVQIQIDWLYFIGSTLICYEQGDLKYVLEQSSSFKKVWTLLQSFLENVNKSIKNSQAVDTGTKTQQEPDKQR